MRSILAVALTALSIATLACGKDSTAPQASIAGAYNLVTVNNGALPFTFVENSTYKAEIVTWRLTFSDNHTFSSIASTRVTSAGNASMLDVTGTGTYMLSGSALTMVDGSSGGGSRAASLVGNTLTLVVDEISVGTLTYVFQR